jgi:hypothetical protein
VRRPRSLALTDITLTRREQIVLSYAVIAAAHSDETGLEHLEAIYGLAPRRAFQLLALVGQLRYRSTTTRRTTPRPGSRTPRLAPLSFSAAANAPPPPLDSGKAAHQRPPQNKSRNVRQALHRAE